MAEFEDDNDIFEFLLFSPCFLPGKIRLKDSKTFVEIEPTSEETVLVFSIDDNSNPDCKLREKLFGNQSGEKICDGLFFYAKGDRRVLCFVELKDNRKDFGDAVEQVTNTYDKVKPRLRRLHPKKNYEVSAFLASYGGSVPQEHTSHQNTLGRFFKSFIYDGKPEDFAKFLRGEEIPKSNQSRKDRRRTRK